MTICLECGYDLVVDGEDGKYACNSCGRLYENYNKDKVIKELLENSDYNENLKEILENYFKQNPDRLKEWQDWFNGKQV